MMRTGNITTAIGAGLREYLRTPVLLGVLVVAPAYLIGLFGYLAPDTPAPVSVPGSGRMMIPLGDVLAILGVVLTTALVGGLIGLFVVQSAADGDGRLVIAGFPQISLLIARGSLVGIASATTVLVAIPTVLLSFEPSSVVLLGITGLLTALTYGMIGIAVGSQVDLLAGVWILLFVPLLDVVLFQNPLATETNQLATVLPGHTPMKLAMDAGFGSGIEWMNLIHASGYLAIVTGIATVLYYRKT